MHKWAVFCALCTAACGSTQTAKSEPIADLDEEDGRVVVRASKELDLAAVAAQMSAKDIGLRHLERRDPSLEEVFMKLTQGLVQ